MEMYKVCSHCKEDKNVNDFHRPDRNVCKICVAIQKKEKYKLFKETSTGTIIKCNVCQEEKPGTDYHYGVKRCKQCTSKLTSRSQNKPTENMPNKCCAQCMIAKNATSFRFRTGICKECEKQNLYVWRANNPEKFKEQLKKYRATDEHKEKRRIYFRSVYATNMNNRISQVFRNRIRSALKKLAKSDNSINMLGCSLDMFRDWLEYNFTEEMSWDNFGVYWHIDHIKPCASFDLSDTDQQLECFSWTNMAPLEKRANMSKGAKIVEHIIQEYESKVEEFQSLIATLPN
jgi:hypothetical protein